ncbi:MAG: permease [Arcobacteraceae bacterium]|nr:permease [Arcobacteraceae bacterium]
MKKAFINSTKSFISTLPMIIAVTGLVGLLQIYITPMMLSNLFGYSDISDTLVGTFIGAISSGNGAISYVIAQGLQEQGVSIYALGAFVLAWVTLGFVQLPAEASVFGVRFTIIRNILALISTMLISYFTVITIGLFI